MKVLMVAPYFYPRLGGLENYVFNTSKVLAQKYGVNVTVVCSNWRREGYQEEMIDGIKVYRLPFLFKVSHTPVNPGWHKKISQIVEREKPDIINGHTPVPYIADIAATVSSSAGIPFVLTCHDSIAQSRFYSILSAFYFLLYGNRTFRLTNWFIVNSPQTAKHFGHLDRKYGQKINVIAPGVDTSSFYPAPEAGKGDGRVILFVGQLFKAAKKGLDDLLKALPQILRKVEGARLLVIGPGPVDPYKKLVARLGLNESVQFIGGVEPSSMPGYYNSADVVVLPSRKKAEGFGMTLIEAQACGTPVVAAAVGGIPFAVVDGETGLLVPSGDTEALAEAVIKVLNDESLAKRLGQSGHKRASTEFTWDIAAAKTLAVYKKAIEAKL